MKRGIIFFTIFGASVHKSKYEMLYGTILYMSDHFTAQNRVKQGGVLSPHLFLVYIDELLCTLKQSGYGLYY